MKLKICKICKKAIKKGEEYSEISHYNKQGKEIERYFYHAECLAENWFKEKKKRK